MSKILAPTQKSSWIERSRCSNRDHNRRIIVATYYLTGKQKNKRFHRGNSEKSVTQTQSEMFGFCKFCSEAQWKTCIPPSRLDSCVTTLTNQKCINQETTQSSEETVDIRKLPETYDQNLNETRIGDCTLVELIDFCAAGAKKFVFNNQYWEKNDF